MRKRTGVAEIKKQLSEEEKKNRMRLAAEKLYNDYLNDPELTVFTCLDSEDFFTSYSNPIERI